MIQILNLQHYEAQLPWINYMHTQIIPNLFPILQIHATKIYTSLNCVCMWNITSILNLSDAKDGQKHESWSKFNMDHMFHAQIHKFMAIFYMYVCNDFKFNLILVLDYHLTLNSQNYKLKLMNLYSITHLGASIFTILASSRA